MVGAAGLNFRYKFAVIAAALLLSGVAGLAQITIPKTSVPPVLDGRVVDSCWGSSALIDEFFQREPDTGEPMTEKTEVFILYDADYIYFGLKCY